MKKIFLLLALSFLGFSSTAQTKIGTIDAEYILAQMPKMTEINKSLETYGTELQADFENTVKEYEGLVTTYQDSLDSFTEEERQTKGNEIVSLENEIKGFRQKASVLIQMRRNELTEPLYTKINEAMLVVIEENGYTQIFHVGASGLAFSAEQYDITDEVLDQLGITVTPDTTE